jgi:hypothetical protein
MAQHIKFKNLSKSLRTHFKVIPWMASFDADAKSSGIF